MAKRCDFCGEVLDEDEEENSEVLGKEVCEECLHGGIEMLQKALKNKMNK
ncbi:MAG: hypothetical protein MUP63_03785 [Candidatus Nanohaloarchaeota archaeon QJJ-7]|nr:hypothetical protein [Candidatus Nanohaloarchaeota archaeon QJJ-7]